MMEGSDEGRRSGKACATRRRLLPRTNDDVEEASATWLGSASGIGRCHAHVMMNRSEENDNGYDAKFECPVAVMNTCRMRIKRMAEVRKVR